MTMTRKPNLREAKVELKWGYRSEIYHCPINGLTPPMTTHFVVVSNLEEWEIVIASAAAEFKYPGAPHLEFLHRRLAGDLVLHDTLPMRVGALESELIVADPILESDFDKYLITAIRLKSKYAQHFKVTECKRIAGVWEL